MRQARMVATKDHFILIASSNKVGTELWAGYGEEFNVQVANTIGFLCAGEVSSFLKTGNSWNAYTTVESPFLLVRPHFGNLGIAAKQESTKFGCIVPRDFHAMEQFSDLSNANLREKHRIEKTNESIEVYQKCKYHQLRDLDTFEHINGDLIPSDYVSDSEIEIEGLD